MALFELAVAIAVAMHPSFSAFRPSWNDTILLSIIATATVVVYITKHTQDSRPKKSLLHREVEVPARPRVVSAVESWFWKARACIYQRLYLPYRSEVSRSIGGLFQYENFTCDCCCLELGGQDVDVEYKLDCQCDTDNLQYCRICISTCLETQITDNHVSEPVCFGRQCILDDRLVRRRLSKSAITILDRNQVMKAVAAFTTENGLDEEKLWHCPSVDCAFAGFVSSQVDPNPPRSSFLRRLFGPKPDDVRVVRCPVCLISSCLFCSSIWTKGMADHDGITCDKYARKLKDSEGDHDLSKWKQTANTQTCQAPHCDFLIEKNDGCNHMTCRCGYQFCWVCGEQWSAQHSYFCRRRRAPEASTTDSSTSSRPGTWFGGWFQ